MSLEVNSAYGTECGMKAIRNGYGHLFFSFNEKRQLWIQPMGIPRTSSIPTGTDRCSQHMVVYLPAALCVATPSLYGSVATSPVNPLLQAVPEEASPLQECHDSPSGRHRRGSIYDIPCQTEGLRPPLSPSGWLETSSPWEFSPSTVTVDDSRLGEDFVILFEHEISVGGLFTLNFGWERLSR